MVGQIPLNGNLTMWKVGSYGEQSDTGNNPEEKGWHWEIQKSTFIQFYDNMVETKPLRRPKKYELAETLEKSMQLQSPSQTSG